jgi:TRAP-type C4-dicarboxylate transport system permease small subunit
MHSFRVAFDRVLEVIAFILMVVVTLIVIAGFTFRWLGHSLVWYDEIAGISLAWLTYYVAALAALRGSHLGFAGFVNAMPPQWRVILTLIGSLITLGFFITLGIAGYHVMSVISGLTLVSIPEAQQSWAFSVIPIGSALFVIAELLRLPETLADARRGPLVDAEIKEVLEEAGALPASGKERAQ